MPLKKMRLWGPSRFARSWRFPAAVVLVIIVCHVALFCGIARTRAARTSSTGGLPMFGPVVSDVWRTPHGSALAARPPALVAEDTAIPPVRHWTLAAIDVLPSARPPSPSEFTPVTEATADPPDPHVILQDPRPGEKPVARPQHLRMVLWVRPEYPNEWVLAGMQGSVVLDLQIDPRGRPAEITVARSSGWKELDQSALHAATLWRFAPPFWKSQPVAVACRIELRFDHGTAVPSPGYP